jgi:lipopolysaccharide export system protein LptA
MSLRRARAALGLILTLAAAAGAGPAPAPAKTDSASSTTALPGMGAFSFTSKKEPIQITSEKLDFDYKNRRTVFHGDVDVIQGDVHLQSDVLTVDYAQVGDQQELKEVTADGHVTITQGPKKATGNHAVFDQASRTVVLTGNAVLEEGSNQVNGDRIVVHPDESRMEVLGENRRVKVILFPGQGPLASGTPGKEKSSPKPGDSPVPAASPGGNEKVPGAHDR